MVMTGLCEFSMEVLTRRSEQFLWETMPINIRYGPERHLIYVGYGSGGIAVLTADGTKIADIPLDAHPESFQVEKNGPCIL